MKRTCNGYEFTHSVAWGIFPEPDYTLQARLDSLMLRTNASP
jgi:hypothetical protein